MPRLLLWLGLLGLPVTASCAQPRVQALPFAQAGGTTLDARWVFGEVAGVTPEHYEVSLDTENATTPGGSVRFVGNEHGIYHTIWTEVPLKPNRKAAFLLEVQWDQFLTDDGAQPFLWVRMDQAEQMLGMVDSHSQESTKVGAWQSTRLLAAIPLEADHLLIGVGLFGAGIAQFDNLQVRLGQASTVSSAAATTYVEDFLEVVESQAMMSGNVDWEQMRLDMASLIQGASSTADTYPAIRYCLEALGDHHSRLLTPAFIASYLTPDTEAVDSPSAIVLPEWERLEGNLGYLWLPGHLSFDEESPRAYASALARGLEGLQDCQGIVLDLRNNDGGNMWPMLAGLGPLLSAEVIGSFQYPNGLVQEWWWRNGMSGSAEDLGTTVEPAHTATFPEDLPIAILTSRWTGSSGEATLVSFLGRSKVRTFGQATAGLSTGNSSLPLADGAILLLTTSVYADRTGKQYGGRIEPDVTVPAQANPGEEDRVLELALDWLQL